MSSGGPPLIAPKVHECVHQFNALCGLLPEADRIARPALVDQLGRLKIWAGNIGAFQELPLPSSLDYRLREAPKIINQVIELLNDLNETLQEVSSIISGERPNRVNAIRDGRTDDLTSDNDENDENEDDASVLSDQSQPSSELQELLESSSDTITSLFKISVLIKSATTRDRYAKAAKAQGEPFDARFDISHVGHKFPLVHQTDWLEKRLGKAITQRRQYLRYCRQHRDRLDNQHKATDVTENAADRHPMPVRKPVEESSQVTKSQIQSLNPPSTFAITTASTLVVNNFESLDEFPEEVQSQTSYATSLNDDESIDMLRVPPLPDEGVRGLPFECPYCWAPQLIKTRRAWKKHIFQDLKPYVCTFEECDLKMFADRSTWFSHELQVHRIEWCCPLCSHSPLQSLVSFEDHLQKRHAQKFIKEQLSALGASCQQSVDKIPPQACPFCDEWSIKLKDANPDLPGDTLVVTPAQFQHHVGSHMEQLALFALPKDHGDAVESTGVAGGADNRSDSELGSKASHECHNNPPLHIAAYEGLEAEVFQLLKDGAKVNAPGHTWGNVLQAAVVGGHVSIVQLLLEYGAEVTLYGGPYGQYSLYTAMQSGKEEMVRLLLEAREKTELKSDEEVQTTYNDHEGREKQEALEFKENRDISLDLETRYQIALRYPRADYTCPVCGEKFGDANQLWSQHAVSRHQQSLGVTGPDDNTEVQKRFIVSAEQLSQRQSQTVKRPQQLPGQDDAQKRSKMSKMETSSSTPAFLRQSQYEIRAKFNDLTWKEKLRLQQRRDSSSQWAQDDLSPQIAKRNRYANIQPWSKSRIHLKVAEGESDYINASPVKLLNPQTGVETKYIVTQAPEQSSCHHFWHMIWHETDDIAVIIMLTPTHEGFIEGCYQYFPLNAEYGSYRVDPIDKTQGAPEGYINLLEMVSKADIEIRKLSLQFGDKIKEVWHFVFSKWPDFAIPENEDRPALLELLRLSTEKNKVPNPKVVHCSAGVGRTGTFIALEHLLALVESGAIADSEEIDAKGDEDIIYNVVNQLREQRMSMVQNEMQYEFLYEVVKEQFEERQRQRIKTTKPPRDSGRNINPL